ncbi:MAG: alpha/beta hydrolase [Thermoanaerobaculia bacterium]
MHEVFRLPVADLRDQLVVRLASPDGPPPRPAVLYLHGFGSHQGGEKAEYFRGRAVEAGLAFCSFDFRGHGASDGDTLGLSLTRNLEEVARVRCELEARHLRPLVLLGSSMGGLTALWHAARHPLGLAAGLAVAPALGFAEALEELLGDTNMRRWQEDGRLRFLNEVGEADVGWGLVEDLQLYDERKLAAELRTPFLLFQGQRDETVDWRRVRAFTESCRCGVALELIPDGNHRLIEHLDAMWDRCLDFLRASGVV